MERAVCGGGDTSKIHPKAFFFHMPSRNSERTRGRARVAPSPASLSACSACRRPRTQWIHTGRMECRAASVKHLTHVGICGSSSRSSSIPSLLRATPLVKRVVYIHRFKKMYRQPRNNDKSPTYSESEISQTPARNAAYWSEFLQRRRYNLPAALNRSRSSGVCVFLGIFLPGSELPLAAKMTAA